MSGFREFSQDPSSFLPLGETHSSCTDRDQIGSLCDFRSLAKGTSYDPTLELDIHPPKPPNPPPKCRFVKASEREGAGLGVPKQASQAWPSVTSLQGRRRA